MGNPAKTSYAIAAVLIGTGLFGLVQIVLGDGRSFLAYVIGGLVLLLCLLVVVVSVTALGWLVDRVSSWRQ